MDNRKLNYTEKLSKRSRPEKKINANNGTFKRRTMLSEEGSAERCSSLPSNPITLSEWLRHLLHFFNRLKFTVVGGCSAERFIQTGCKEFHGDDPVLARHLKRRLGSQFANTSLSYEKLPKDVEDNFRIMRAITDDPYASGRKNAGINMNITHLNNTRKYYYEPPDSEHKARLIEAMQHHIYLTQYRMQHLKNITDKYSHDISFRVALLFARIDTLIMEMRVCYTYMNKTQEWKWWYFFYDNRRKTTVLSQLRYYTHILRRNIDITYLYEYMIEMHTGFMVSNYSFKNIESLVLGNKEEFMAQQTTRRRERRTRPTGRPGDDNSEPDYPGGRPGLPGKGGRPGFMDDDFPGGGGGFPG